MATLRIYDVHTDEYRDATQVDLDQMQAVVNAYWRLRASIAQDHEQLQRELREIKSRAGVPA